MPRRKIANRAPRGIQQQWVLEGTLRKQPLRQSRKKHHREFATANLVNRPHEHATPSALRRLGAQETKTLAQDFGDFLYGNGSYFAHRLQLGERRQHACRIAQRSLRKLSQAFEPLAPMGRSRKHVEPRDQRQSERRERAEPLKLLSQIRALRFARFHCRLDSQLKLALQTLEPALPARSPSDDGGVDDQLFPRRGCGDEGVAGLLACLRSRLGTERLRPEV